MNFLVLIGIIESIERKEKNSILNLKIERNNNINRKIWFEILKVNIDNEKFVNELEKIKRGDIVGVRGRVGVNNNLINLICERLQPL